MPRGDERWVQADSLPVSHQRAVEVVPTPLTDCTVPEPEPCVGRVPVDAPVACLFGIIVSLQEKERSRAPVERISVVGLCGEGLVEGSEGVVVALRVEVRVSVRKSGFEHGGNKSKP